jgi:hypothetical protein
MRTPARFGLEKANHPGRPPAPHKNYPVAGPATTPGEVDFRNKIREIKALSGYAAILTWLYTVSMVRAAFKGGGALIPASAAKFRVSTAWPTARGTATAGMEVATNRLTKPRFPQGSEVWIIGCPKFGTAETSGLTNPGLEVETALPEPRRWHAVSGFLRS